MSSSTFASPRRVRVLPAPLANQIAAGEVVERPASVAKELLENSLDAGARRIRVEVEQGGMRLVRVRDDGAGIHREDLGLALGRHATSKIAAFEDLERVRSLGFRGEALPSIASVSRLRLASRPHDEEEGWEVRCEGGGAVEGPAPAPQPPGTTVEVQDLFFNTPARRRFMRTEKTEQRHLEEILTRVALSRPEVALTLVCNGREVLTLRPAADPAGLERRLARICGAAFVEHALAVDAGTDPAPDPGADADPDPSPGALRLRGWAGLPSWTRGRTDLQHFFVNGRMVRDRLLAHAVRQAYQDLLPAGRQPAYVLHLELDPLQVDVNVHPTKHEVRFRESRLVHDFVWRTLARALTGGTPLPGTDAIPAPVPAPPAQGPRPAGGTREAVAAYAALHPVAAPGAKPPHGGGEPPLGHALGRLHGRHFVAQNASGLLLVDFPAARRAACERRLRSAFAAGEVRSQPLLLPADLVVGEARANAAEQASQLFAELGFDLRRSGPESVCLRSVPALLREASPGSLVEELLDALEGSGAEGGTAPPDALQDTLAQALAGVAAGASGAGGSPGPAPAVAELDALLRELEALGLHFPGEQRPALWVSVGTDEIEALFRRLS